MGIAASSRGEQAGAQGVSTDNPQGSWNTWCEVLISKVLCSPASLSIWIHSTQQKSITALTIPPTGRNHCLCRQTKAFYIRHPEAHVAHSTESQGRRCPLPLQLPCLLANNKNLSEQMKVTFETSKTCRALCHRDILQAWQATCYPMELSIACRVQELWLNAPHLES